MNSGSREALSHDRPQTTHPLEDVSSLNRSPFNPHSCVRPFVGPGVVQRWKLGVYFLIGRLLFTLKS